MILGKLSPSAARAGTVGLSAAPIPPDWIVSGAPHARSAKLSASIDNDASTCLWDCSAGTFHWHFGCDETVHIIEGGVTVSFEDETMVLSAGDTAYFPAGAVTLWHVENYVRKVAFLRVPAPRAISLSLRILRRLRSLMAAGPAAKSGLGIQSYQGS